MQNQYFPLGLKYRSSSLQLIQKVNANRCRALQKPDAYRQQTIKIFSTVSPARKSLIRTILRQTISVESTDFNYNARLLFLTALDPS